MVYSWEHPKIRLMIWGTAPWIGTAPCENPWSFPVAMIYAGCHMNFTKNLLQLPVKLVKFQQNMNLKVIYLYNIIYHTISSIIIIYHHYGHLPLVIFR